MRINLRDDPESCIYNDGCITLQKEIGLPTIIYNVQNELTAAGHSFAFLGGLGTQYIGFSVSVDANLNHLSFKDIIAGLRSHDFIYTFHNQSINPLTPAENLAQISSIALKSHQTQNIEIKSKTEEDGRTRKKEEAKITCSLDVKLGDEAGNAEIDAPIISDDGLKLFKTFPSLSVKKAL